MRTLLHVCCGPCATATVAFWRGEGLSLTGYFYNPNIHPLLEFRRRMTGAEDLAEHANMEIILIDTMTPWSGSRRWEQGKRTCVGPVLACGCRKRPGKHQRWAGKPSRRPWP